MWQGALARQALQLNRLASSLPIGQQIRDRANRRTGRPALPHEESQRPTVMRGRRRFNSPDLLTVTMRGSYWGFVNKFRSDRPASYPENPEDCHSDRIERLQGKRLADAAG
jgi:hypothetical protein